MKWVDLLLVTESVLQNIKKSKFFKNSFLLIYNNIDLHISLRGSVRACVRVTHIFMDYIF